MSYILVARRYAQALYEEAQREEIVEKVDEDIDLIQASLDGSRELVRFFASPVISRQKKEAVIGELFAERLQPVTLRFLRLLVEKGREETFPSVVQAYRELRDRELGIVEARARVAQPLGDDGERQLAEALEAMTGRRVRLDVVEDDDLLGGIIVRVGDVVYDGSARHQLETLRTQLERGALV